MLKKIYICAPLGAVPDGDVRQHLEAVRQYTKYALLCGTAPVVPHFYAECLDDGKPDEREQGMAAGLSLLWFCDEMWVFGDVISEGMQREIRFCQHLRIRIRRIADKEIQKVLGGKRNEKEND